MKITREVVRLAVEIVKAVIEIIFNHNKETKHEPEGGKHEKARK